MEQAPILAICYDFDHTLSPDDMQAAGYIQSVGFAVEDFWRESRRLAEQNEMDRNLAYMYLMAKTARVPVADLLSERDRCPTDRSRHRHATTLRKAPTIAFS